MADTYYKLVPGANANKDWTSEVILERDDDGNTLKSVSVDRPAQLNKDEIDLIESLGYGVAKSSKEDAVAAAVTSAAGGDAAQAPILGTNDQTDEK